MLPVIVIVGPTGVGKTKMSVELAGKIKGEVINADSMQVYRGLDIGTAKVGKSEKKGVPHHLFDIKKVNEEYTIYDYQSDARREIEKIRRKGKNPIMVGGSGLYIKAALYDYRFANEDKEKDTYDDLTNEEIIDRLFEHEEEVDIHVNNRKRLIRALQRVEAGDSLEKHDELLYDAIFIGLTTKRDRLYERINDRVDEMFDEGLVEEVFKYKNYLEEYQSLKTGIGYKEFVPYFNEEKNLDEVKDTIKKNSRRYAKRQYTFFRNQMNIKWFDVDFDNFDKTIDEVYSYINDIGNDLWFT